MEGYAGIFDMDVEYRSCLMRGLMEKNALPLPLVEFTRLDSILTFAREKRLELLLISETALTQEVLDAEIGRMILLTEEPVQEDMKGAGQVPAHIFKYQPLQAIAGAIQCQYSFTQPCAAAVCLYRRQADVYGIYSPVKRCLKSSFAVALAQLLGEQQRTLLLSFEANSALLSMLDLSEAACAVNLSDALYYYLQGTLPAHKAGLVGTCHSFDFIAPAKNPEDLEGMRAEDAAGFIRYFAQECGYSCIVIDFGDALTGISRILPCCDRIFMPIKADWISEKKKSCYLDYIQKKNPELCARFEEVRPPYHHIGTEGRGRLSGKFRELVSGEFYDYVRQCL